MSIANVIGAATGGVGGGVVGRAFVELSARQEKLKADMAQARATVEGETAAMGTSTQKFSAGAAVAFGVAAIAAIKFAASSVSAFREAQEVQAQTAARIASTGGAANVTAQQVGALAGRIQDLTGIEDESIQSGANMLLTFINIRNEVGKGNDVFNQAVGVLADMSVAFGKADDGGNSMQTMAIKLGKALNDPIKGMTALSRVGVAFTNQQKEQIVALTNTGRVLEAQQVIIAELRTEFGGAAEAYGRTYSGAVARLSANLNDLTESFGEVIVRGIEPTITLLNGAVDVLNAIPQPLKTVAITAGVAATAVIGFGIAVRLAKTAMDTLGISMGQVPIRQFITRMATMAATLPGVTAAVTALSRAVTFLGGGFKAAFAVGAIIQGTRAIAAAIATTKGEVYDYGESLGLTDAALDKLKEDSTGFVRNVGALVQGQGPFDEFKDKLDQIALAAQQSGMSLAQTRGYIEAHANEIANLVSEADDLDSMNAALAALFSREASERAQRMGVLINENAAAVDALGRVTGQSFREFRAAAVKASEEGYEAVREFTAGVVEEVTDFRNDVAENFADVETILGDLADKQKLSAGDIITAFQRQARAIENYRRDWTEVQREVGPAADELLVHVQDLGLDGAQFMNVFANATDREQRRIVSSFGDIQGKSNDLGSVITNDLLPAIRTLVDSIREAADLPPVRWDFKADTSDVESKTRTLIDRLKRMGFAITPGTLKLAGMGEFHSGGAIPGQRGREVPIVAKTGEYVVRDDVVAKPGVRSLLDAINEERVHIPKQYHEGGLVGPSPVARFQAPGLTVDALLSKLSGGAGGPAAWGGFRNGMIPISALTPIGRGFYLEPEAARAFMGTSLASNTKVISNVVSAYRNLQQQSDLWESSRHGTLWTVAPPGSSMHGWGKATDVSTGSAGWNAMRGVGSRFGWRWGGVFGDPPHFSYGITADQGVYATRGMYARLRRHEAALPLDAPETRHALATAVADALDQPRTRGRVRDVHVHVAGKVERPEDIRRNIDWWVRLKGH